MLKIYVFGNSLVKEDTLPLEILPELKKKYPKIEFLVVDPNENFPPPGEKELVILDTVKGIEKPALFQLSDLQNMESSPISPHDYDVLFHLLLLKKLKKIDTAVIIGVPSKFKKEKLLELLPLYFKEVSGA